MKSKSPKVAQASGIPVFCKYDRLADPEELEGHPDNAHRKHPAKQLDRYERVIAGDGKTPGNGWRKSLVVSALSGRIIKGHGAWLMAKRRGWLVPIEVQQYRDTKEERRDLLADNKLALLAENDDALLAKLLADMDADDLQLAGYDPAELAALLRDAETIEGEFPITAKLNERYDYVLIFTENESDFVFLQTLCGVRQERSYKKTGIGVGRAVPFARALAALRANRHSLDVQGGDADHAPTASRRPRVRPGKPAR